jgi:phosphopentomutase
MTLSEQVDALQAKVADLKSSLDASRHETNEQIKARVANAKAKADAAKETVHGKADQAADHAHTQWQSFKASNSAKMQELQERIERKRDERDVKAAERDAERAEDNAADALDYASWAIDQAEVAALDAADARAWADARAAASPPS